VFNVDSPLGADTIVEAPTVPIAGLTNGGTYYVLAVDDDRIRLAASPGGAPIDLDPSGAADSAHSIGDIDFASIQVFADDNSISHSAHGLVAGQAVVYRARIFYYDVLDFSASSGNITVDLSVAGARTVNANLTLSCALNVEDVIGGSGNDTI